MISTTHLRFILAFLLAPLFAPQSISATAEPGQIAAEPAISLKGATVFTRRHAAVPLVPGRAPVVYLYIPGSWVLGSMRQEMERDFEKLRTLQSDTLRIGLIVAAGDDAEEAMHSLIDRADAEKLRKAEDRIARLRLAAESTKR